MSYELQRIFEITGTFSSSTKYHFLQKFWYLQWNLLDLKKSRFLCVDTSHIQKDGGVTACIFCTVRKQNKISEAARLITHLQDIISIRGTFEELCLNFPEHLFCKTHFSGCFLRLYHSYYVVFQRYSKTLKYIWICFFYVRH